VKDEPGLIVTALHRSKDGAWAINYAQWRPEAANVSFVAKHREQSAARLPLATRVDPHLYDVIYLHDRKGREDECWASRS
jgi:hypothetical protein